MLKSSLLGAAGVACLLATRLAVGAAENPASMADNPFYTASPLPFHYPPFDRITDADYRPAFERGMADQLKEDDAIANNPEKPTFDNTILAMERGGRILDRVSNVFSNLKDLEGDATLAALDKEMAPKLAAESDEIYLNPKLWARVKELYDARSTLGLDPESLRLLERYRRDFVRAGANLSDADKTRLKALNAEAATLEATFRQNVLAERNAAAVLVPDKAALAGLSDAEIATAAAAGVKAKHPGEYVIPLVNTTIQDDFALLSNRALREEIMEKSLGRGSSGGPYDNQAVVVALAKNRAERAALLGYASYAAYKAEIGTARTVEAIDGLLAQLVGPTVAQCKRDDGDLQAVVDQEHGGFQVAAWDWDFYAQKVQKARYALDENQLKPYLELNSVLENGVFYAAHKLYGISFKERHDLPVYNPDVRVFQVYDQNGKPLAILLEDFYARPSKVGGAWMNQYVRQNSLLGDQPVVGNHHNIAKPAPGQPTLLTFDQAVTLFHEFGHGLHGMFSQVKYPTFGGTSVPRDFVEYPSQVNEMWAEWPEVVKNYAKHYQTGEPMPAALLDKMLASRKFNQGYATLSYLKATLEDQAWHTLKPDQVPSDVPALEAATFKKYGADFDPVPPRYRSTYFSHVFASDGYSAGYYSYIWADVLVADSIEWFKQHGGLTRANGDHFRATVLSHGGSVEAMDLFREFTGHGPEVAPLLRKRGLD
jgi:peptidyl-dipeptidase Dcp